jgi:XTP/dITP diphosphohydrolase
VTLYCATTNPGKLREFCLAAGLGFTIEPLPNLGNLPAPEENGSTFEANAVIKALAYGRHTAGWLFAEDSGIEVAALGGAPGVLSARFAGPGATDEANNALLMDRLRGIADRRARYVCAIALVHKGELAATFEGTVEGELTESPRGSGGFGYDPFFFYPAFHRTFAEVSPEVKFQVSHRRRALDALYTWLRQTVSGE